MPYYTNDEAPFYLMRIMIERENRHANPNFRRNYTGISFHPWKSYQKPSWYHYLWIMLKKEWILIQMNERKKNERNIISSKIKLNYTIERDLFGKFIFIHQLHWAPVMLYACFRLLNVCRIMPWQRKLHGNLSFLIQQKKKQLFIKIWTNKSKY